MRIPSLIRYLSTNILAASNLSLSVFFFKQLVQELLIAGAKVDIKDEDERIPLHYAAE